MEELGDSLPGVDHKLQALLTAAHDATIAITSLAELVERYGDLQTAHWARHRRSALDQALDAVVADVAAQRGLTEEQAWDAIRAGSTIRDTPEPEDPEESPFRAITSP